MSKKNIKWESKLTSHVQLFYDKIVSVKKSDLKGKEWKTIYKTIKKEGVNIFFIVDGQNDKVVEYNQVNQIQILLPHRNSPRLWWFIHRLRNAFSHLNIVESNNYYYIKDEDVFKHGKTELTMYGCVEQTKLINILNSI